MKFRKVAIVGATGLVGKETLSIMEDRKFPCDEVYVFASDTSVGAKLPFSGNNLTVGALNNNTFKGIDLAFFATSSDVSKYYVPIARESGTMVIDKSSYFRMDKDVPLVVSEVNAHQLKSHQGLIANPNCSTIQMVVALNPIRKLSPIRRIVVSTYQAVTGAGKVAKEELWKNLKSIFLEKTDPTKVNSSFFPHPISMNVIPYIGKFREDGFSGEEEKMILETQKIFGDDTMIVSPTTVRVPVDNAHSESIYLETEKELYLADVKLALRNEPAIVFKEAQEDYPTPLDVSGKDEVFVGRLRKDRFVKNGLHLWVVADNLRKGAALNAVQIAELLLEM